MKQQIGDELDIPNRIRQSTALVVAKLSHFGVDDFVKMELFVPSNHLLQRPGKLLRPALVFLGADYIGERRLADYVGLAAAVELLHISSLIHDDIVDKDAKRRGVAATHVRYGLESAILSGDALIAKAIEEANRYGGAVVDSISRTALKMCAGEVSDYGYQRDKAIPKMSEYLEVVDLKSSSLIGVSTSIAALHKSDNDSQRLYEFGAALGTAFQIRDDVVDFLHQKGPGKKAKDYRLNAVRCLQEHEAHDVESALAEARRLNNIYVNKAISKLGSGSRSSLLAGYAKRVAMDLSA